MFVVLRQKMPTVPHGYFPWVFQKLDFCNFEPWLLVPPVVSLWFFVMDMIWTTETSKNITNIHGQVLVSPVNYISNVYFAQRFYVLCSRSKLSGPISQEPGAFWQINFNSLVVSINMLKSWDILGWSLQKIP